MREITVDFCAVPLVCNSVALGCYIDGRFQASRGRIDAVEIVLAPIRVKQSIAGWTPGGRLRIERDEIRDLELSRTWDMVTAALEAQFRHEIAETIEERADTPPIRIGWRMG